MNILHEDHDLTEEQLDFVREHLQKNAPDGFFIIEIRIPDELGTVPNAMKGPVCGDPPVKESEAWLEPRGDRPWADRMTWGKHRPCNYVQAIGVGDTVFTVYGGPLAPQNPDDPSNADPQASREFWAEHALMTGYTLEQSIAADVMAHMREEE